MTLLELVVGITIAGVAMAAGYGALATILDHRERVDTVSQASSVAASQRKLLKEWLEGAHLVVTGSGPAFQGLDGVYQDEPDDQLTLLTSGWPMPNAGEVIVRLFVDRVRPPRSMASWPRFGRFTVSRHGSPRSSRGSPGST